VLELNIQDNVIVQLPGVHTAVNHQSISYFFNIPLFRDIDISKKSSVVSHTFLITTHIVLVTISCLPKKTFHCQSHATTSSHNTTSITSPTQPPQPAASRAQFHFKNLVGSTALLVFICSTLIFVILIYVIY
jgi:hypothetical protein